LEADWEGHMTCSTFETSASHDFTCLSLRPCAARPTTLSPTWSERNPSIQKNSVPLQLRQIKVFECLVRQTKALWRVTMALKPDHTWEKSSTQQTEWGPDPGRQRLWMLYELIALRPLSWALSWELHGKDPDCLSRLVITTYTHDGFERPCPRDYVDTKYWLAYE
jgi:hypothetical protein